MKYLKYFEHIEEEPKIYDYVVAYRPYTTTDIANNTQPIVHLNYIDYTIEIGQIKKNKSDNYYNIFFPKSNTQFLRPKEHILFSSPSLEETEEKLQTILDKKKFNL